MRILLSSLLIIFAHPVSAGELNLMCSDYRPMLRTDELKRPAPPLCASVGFQFSDEYDFQNCQAQMEQYKRKINGYSDCLVSEQRQALENFNETVESFNRKASN